MGKITGIIVDGELYTPVEYEETVQHTIFGKAGLKKYGWTNEHHTKLITNNMIPVNLDRKQIVERREYDNYCIVKDL